MTATADLAARIVEAAARALIGVQMHSEPFMLPHYRADARAAIAAAVREAGLDAAELRLTADDVWHPDRVSFHPGHDPAPATAALLRALADIADAG